MHASQIVAVLAIASFAAQSASAQTVFTNAPTVQLVELPTYPYFIDSSISSVTATSTADGFLLQGDVTLRYDRAQSSEHTGVQPIFQLLADRRFTVGPLPVDMHTELQENLEAILGNGTAAAPDLEFRTYVNVFIEDGGYPFIPPLLVGGIGYSPEGGLGTEHVVGNNSRIFNTDASSGSYILGPGFNYRIEYRLEAWINNDLLAATDPPPTLTFEFGGVSEFAGMQISAKGVLLPEPSSIALAATGLALVTGAAVRKRSRPRR